LATLATLATAAGNGSKAWVIFDGTPSTPSIRAKYNVASVTKNASGDYTVNFTAALASANYAAVPFTSAINNGVYGKFANIVGNYASNTTPTTSAIRIFVGYTSSNNDEPWVGVVVFVN
jgi:hypothetical protein